ncbi:MAG: hypothetical protein MZU91_08095 [Desulfosudis oleivorans]|nr:hypothetical protein [Desulfosudis oleivorans]
MYVPFAVQPSDLGQCAERACGCSTSPAPTSPPRSRRRSSRYLDILSEGARIIGAINTIGPGRRPPEGLQHQRHRHHGRPAQSRLQRGGPNRAGLRHRRSGPDRGLHPDLAAGARGLGGRPQRRAGARDRRPVQRPRRRAGAAGENAPARPHRHQRHLRCRARMSPRSWPAWWKSSSCAAVS